MNYFERLEQLEAKRKADDEAKAAYQHYAEALHGDPRESDAARSSQFTPQQVRAAIDENAQPLVLNRIDVVAPQRKKPGPKPKVK